MHVMLPTLEYGRYICQCLRFWMRDRWKR